MTKFTSLQTDFETYLHDDSYGIPIPDNLKKNNRNAFYAGAIAATGKFFKAQHNPQVQKDLFKQLKTECEEYLDSVGTVDEPEPEPTFRVETFPMIGGVAKKLYESKYRYLAVAVAMAHLPAKGVKVWVRKIDPSKPTHEHKIIYEKA